MFEAFFETILKRSIERCNFPLNLPTSMVFIHMLQYAKNTPISNIDVVRMSKERADTREHIYRRCEVVIQDVAKL